jgi:hypothetical protein
VGAFEKDLVGSASGDAHDVASRKLLTNATLNGAIALFTGSNGLPIQIVPMGPGIAPRIGARILPHKRAISTEGYGS